MIIRVLPHLNSQQAWMEFFQRELSYCFVETPECLVDFQTTYLQITLLSGVYDGRDAVKYSLGSRTSVEPVWALVKACDWRLDKVIEGLNSLDFNSNVRDNGLLGVHSDLTARKFFNKDRQLISPNSVGLLEPITQPPKKWTRATLLSLLTHKQFENFAGQTELVTDSLPSATTQDKTPHASTTASHHPQQLAQHIAIIHVDQLTKRLTQFPEHWHAEPRGSRLRVYHRDLAVAEFTPIYHPPKPRLAPFS